MSDYYNLNRRLLNMGLNLRDDPDTVPEGYYTRVRNIIPSQEGSVNTRPGRVVQYTPHTGEIHTLFKLDNDTVVSGSGARLARNLSLYTTTAFNGTPLTWAFFKPPNSITSWAYVTDGTVMKKVNADGSFYNWGIAAPTNQPSYVATGNGNLNSAVAGAIVYDWKYTYYNTTTGAESNGSATQSGISVVNQRAEITVYASPDPQVDTIRIYRRGGTQTTKWRLSIEASNANGVYTDNNADSAIALNQELEDDNYVPFTSVDANGNAVYGAPVPYVWGPFVGKYIFGCGDDNRPGELYWTNPDRSDSADVFNHIPVTQPQEPLMGGFIYSSLPYVWSSAELYAVDFGGPNALPTFTSRKTPTGRGLAAPYAYAVGRQVAFVSGDGIYETDCQSPAQSITEETLRPLFQGFTVEGIAPIDWTAANKIRLIYAGREYHFFYQDTLGGRVHLVYDIFYQRWHLEDSAVFTEVVAYYDDVSQPKSVLTGTTNGRVEKIGGTDDDGTAISANIRLGSEYFGDHLTLKEIGNVLLDADPQNTSITFTPLKNGETSTLTPTVVTGNGRQLFSIPFDDDYVYNLGIDLAWSGPAKLYQCTYLYRPDEEEIKHWEFPKTSHGFPGWQHVRDLYLALVSTDTITLTVEVDGESETYTVPSTNGVRTKQHVWLRPLKGKMFRYKLDCSAPFRIYGEDCEVRVKPWNTGLGYQLVSPFREAGAPTPART